MNVLVVDDQIDVVQGVIAGINWNDLGVENVYPAYSANEAKALFYHHPIHVLLSDIEMPMNNGLELFKWVKANYPANECIFLSSHPEFEYAQEAIQLGSFDYILQPARYEDIQASIKRAIDKINTNAQVQQVYEYGVYWQQNEETILDNCVRSFLINPGNNLSKLLIDLGNLHIHVSPKTHFYPILIHLNSCDSLNQWENARMKYELRKTLSTSLESQMIFVQLDRLNYIALIYTDHENQYVDLKLVRMMELFLATITKEMQVSATCYIADPSSLDSLKQQYQTLCLMRQNDVAGYSTVYTSQHLSAIKESIYTVPDMSHWSMLIRHGSGDVVHTQVHQYLQHQKKLGVITAEFLARFHQDFIQMFLTVAGSLKLNVQDIFFKQYSYEDYILAYTSLDKMMALIDFAMNYIESHTTELQEVRSPIEKAISYINHNIEKSLSRAEIAEAIYLNPEYLSRLFKRVQGISLNDFIVTQKMEIAKSLLSNTNIPIHIVASKVGYSNFSYFSQVFKKICRLTPVEYRQEHGKHLE